MKEREYDIIVFGATGFTGKLVVEYIIEQYGLKNNKLFRVSVNLRFHLSLGSKLFPSS